jgi:hydrogenase maturation protease
MGKPLWGVLPALMKVAKQSTGEDREMKVRVIACGNPLMGNDAAGLSVMSLLQERDPEIEVVDGGNGGLGLITLMEGYDRIVIVDATSGMGEIGKVQVFRGIPDSGITSLSLHELGVREVLALARTLGTAPEVVIVGIEGGQMPGFSGEMDPAVRAAIPEASKKVAEEVRR